MLSILILVVVWWWWLWIFDVGKCCRVTYRQCAYKRKSKGNYGKVKIKVKVKVKISMLANLARIRNHNQTKHKDKYKDTYKYKYKCKYKCKSYSGEAPPYDWGEDEIKPRETFCKTGQGANSPISTENLWKYIRY